MANKIKQNLKIRKNSEISLYENGEEKLEDTLGEEEGGIEVIQ